MVVERPTAQGATLTLRHDLLFDFDQVSLEPDAAAALGWVVGIIRQRHPAAVSVVGHTDADGADALNAQFSLRRAEAVRNSLAEDGGGGLPPFKRKGEREPFTPDSIAGTDNPASRARNRRVELLLQK